MDIKKKAKQLRNALLLTAALVGGTEKSQARTVLPDHNTAGDKIEQAKPSTDLSCWNRSLSFDQRQALFDEGVQKGDIEHMRKMTYSPDGRVGDIYTGATNSNEELQMVEVEDSRISFITSGPTASYSVIKDGIEVELSVQRHCKYTDVYNKQNGQKRVLGEIGYQTDSDMIYFMQLYAADGTLVLTDVQYMQECGNDHILVERETFVHPKSDLAKILGSYTHKTFDNSARAVKAYQEGNDALGDVYLKKAIKEQTQEENRINKQVKMINAKISRQANAKISQQLNTEFLR